MRELGGTVVLVAHRQTTYMNASCIICFCNGRIIEHAVSEIEDAGGAADGSAHQKLMGNNGEYHALFTGCTEEESKARELAKTGAEEATEATEVAGPSVAVDDVMVVHIERTVTEKEKELRASIR